MAGVYQDEGSDEWFGTPPTAAAAAATAFKNICEEQRGFAAAYVSIDHWAQCSWVEWVNSFLTVRSPRSGERALPATTEGKRSNRDVPVYQASPYVKGFPDNVSEPKTAFHRKESAELR
jgi:hypothetical protein